jgi:23S rRNA pseudouridine2605 synthase
MRLARYLAHCGVASRRAAEVLIAAGRVTVAGERVTDPARDVSEGDAVAVDGTAVEVEEHEVWALNKPLDVTSTAREPGRRRAVVDLVDSNARLYPVGRLDADSTGLILLTNDGELANRLTHPRYEVPKTYRVELRRPPSEDDLRQLESGVDLEDGPTLPAQVRRAGERSIEVTIREGRKRQLRRMIDVVGNEVVSLRRIRFGSLELGSLGDGQSRQLDNAEVARLWKDARAMDSVDRSEDGSK